MSPIVWIIILLLIAVNALYVAAEFAAVGVRHSRIRQLAEDGNRLAIRLLPYLENAHALDRYIAACQIGITISSLILGAYGQATLSDYLVPLFSGWGGMQSAAAESASAIVILVGLTVFQMILGELVPKSLALQFPTQAALYTVFPMKWSLWLLSWFVTTLNGAGNLILRVFGKSMTGHRHIHSASEIEMLIVESRDGGLLEPDEQRRLHRALQLGSRPAHQLMVPRRFMSALNVDTPPEQILQIVVSSPFTRLPVFQDSIDNIIGMVHAKDVLVYYIEHGKLDSIRKIMRPMAFIADSVMADRVIGLMRKHKSRQAVVLDEFGGVSGLVTVENILADVLGKNQTRFVPGQVTPEKLPDGRIRLPGTMRLLDGEEWIGVTLEGDMDTIGGLLIDRLGYLPGPGEQVDVDGIRFEVEQVDNRMIQSILVTPAPSEATRD